MQSVSVQLIILIKECVMQALYNNSLYFLGNIHVSILNCSMRNVEISRWKLCVCACVLTRNHQTPLIIVHTCVTDMMTERRSTPLLHKKAAVVGVSLGSEIFKI